MGETWYLNDTIKLSSNISAPIKFKCDNYKFNYRLNIFYVDRLTDDKANKIDVHANSIIFINSLLKALDDEYIISDYEIFNFNERFNDVCAGAYVSCRIQMPISECYDFPGEKPI